MHHTKLPYPFTEEDMEHLLNVMKIIRTTAITHFGLGRRIALLKAFDVGNMGCLLAGNKGIGKSKTLQALRRIRHRSVFDEEVTLASIDKEINDIFSNRHVSWFAYDLAKVSDEVVKGILRLASSLIYDHECRVRTSQYRANISNSTISFIGALTPDKFERLQYQPEWQQMFSERFILLMDFALTRKMIRKNVPYTRMIDNPGVLDVRTVKVTRDSLWEEIKELLEYQLTDERAEENTDNILGGIAAMCGRRKTCEADAKFVLMHEFNFKCPVLFGNRSGLTSPLEFDFNAMWLFGEAIKRHKVSIEYVMEKRAVDRESVMEAIESRPSMFRVRHGNVFPNPNVMIKYLAPQLKFEKYCYERANEYIGGT